MRNPKPLVLPVSLSRGRFTSMTSPYLAALIEKHCFVPGLSVRTERILWWRPLPSSRSANRQRICKPSLCSPHAKKLRQNQVEVLPRWYDLFLGLHWRESAIVNSARTGHTSYWSKKVFSHVIVVWSWNLRYNISILAKCLLSHYHQSMTIQTAAGDHQPQIFRINSNSKTSLMPLIRNLINLADLQTGMISHLIAVKQQ